jgi:hypothetical protein
MTASVHVTNPVHVTNLTPGSECNPIFRGPTLTFDTSLFPPLKGAGVFPLVSSLNHSCDPNCEVAYIDDAKVLVVLLRDVAPGEELTITYVDADFATERRREELKEVYGFDCKCAKCVPGVVKGVKTPTKRKAEAAGAAGGKRKASDPAGKESGGKKAKKGEGNGCVVC